MDTNMDEHSQSLLLYYGFECKQDTNYTCQISVRCRMSLMDFIRDTRSNYNSTTALGTGSAYEGTFSKNSFPHPGNENAYLFSDMDVMSVSHKYQVYPFDFCDSYDLSKYCLQMTRSQHTRPGFCLLQATGDKHVDLDLYFQKEQSDFYKLFNDFENNGPAFTRNTISDGKTILHDKVIALKSNHWLNDCCIWPRVIKTGWPSAQLQSEIKKEGFHVVKVGHPLSPEKDREWRISFSVAERMLIESFNPTQLKCAVVMKLLVKYFITPVVPDSISSYHIKTLMLWSVEKDTQQKWEPQYFIHCLTELLTNLRECISVVKLQHYFIPENNLLDCKVTKENREMLLRVVDSLRQSVINTCLKLLNWRRESLGQYYSLGRQQLISLKLASVRGVIEPKAQFPVDVLSYLGIFVSSWLEEYITKWVKDYKLPQQSYCEAAKRFHHFTAKRVPRPKDKTREKLLNKFLHCFQTWCGTTSISFCKSYLFMDNMDYLSDNQEGKPSLLVSDMFILGLQLLVESYENSSTTGCIKMALVEMSFNRHYHAVPLLNRALNIIDQFEDYSLHRNVPPYNGNFTEYMHIYNDQNAIEAEVTSLWLTDKVLFDTQFVWLEKNVLPGILQLELTNTIYNIDIANFSEIPIALMNNFFIQSWNPLPLTHFLLFLCHNKLLQSVTFLDPACIYEDIENLLSIMSDRQRLRQDDILSVLNLLAWCYLQLEENTVREEFVKCVVFTAQQSKGCDKTLFSHLLIMHTLSAVLHVH